MESREGPSASRTVRNVRAHLAHPHRGGLMELVTTTCTCRIIEGHYPVTGEPTTWVIPDNDCHAPEHEE